MAAKKTRSLSGTPKQHAETAKRTIERINDDIKTLKRDIRGMGCKALFSNLMLLQGDSAVAFKETQSAKVAPGEGSLYAELSRIQDQKFDVTEQFFKKCLVNGGGIGALKASGDRRRSRGSRR